MTQTTNMDTKYGQSETPVNYSKHNLYAPTRKLWKHENLSSPFLSDGWNSRNNGMKWDDIQSPQFVDFSNLPDIGDSYFNKATVVISTPIPGFNHEKPPKTVEEDMLVSSFGQFCLSSIRYDAAEHECQNVADENEKDKEEYPVHATNAKAERIKSEVCGNVKKSQKTVVNPFNFEMRNKYTQQRKQERINKILEEQQKPTVFRANPVPKYIKARPPTASSNNNNNNKNNNDALHSDKVNGNRVQKISFPERQVQVNTEVQRKPMPPLTKKPLERPKPPILRTAIRAQQRKRFDVTLQEKERQREQLRQMEIAAKKKQEEEELKQLRKEIVHKAQPIRRYKLGLPNIEKRPLTDPVSPISLKRRRRA